MDGNPCSVTGESTCYSFIYILPDPKYRCLHNKKQREEEHFIPTRHFQQVVIQNPPYYDESFMHYLLSYTP